MTSNLTFTLQQTPFGTRLAGPDPDRVMYLTDRAPVIKLQNNGAEPVWSSNALELYVAPIPNGVAVTVKIYFGAKLAQTAA
jgi:hypothetical protein